MRPGARVGKGQPLGPLGFLLSGHHLHLELISRDKFDGLEPSGTREQLVAQGSATANRHRSVRGDTKRAYWGPSHRSAGWIWYHTLHFMRALAGKVAFQRAPGDGAKTATNTAPGPAPSPAPGATPSPVTPPLAPPQEASRYRKFRLTHYYVADQGEYPDGDVTVPILNKGGTQISAGSPGFFASLSLEGAGKLRDGRLLNVTGAWVKVDARVYAPVLAYHRRYLPKRPTQYSGLRVSGDQVTHALAFSEVPATAIGRGYGTQSGIPFVPFRTLAADVGAYRTSEPRFHGKGGLVPRGTKVFIKNFVGVGLPDGTVHDGWFVVNDTGGAIFGAHFDVFAGTRAQARKVKLPSVADVWYPGIETRIPTGYSYGLHDA